MASTAGHRQGRGSYAALGPSRHQQLQQAPTLADCAYPWSVSGLSLKAGASVSHMQYRRLSHLVVLGDLVRLHVVAAKARGAFIDPFKVWAHKPDLLIIVKTIRVREMKTCTQNVSMEESLSTIWRAQSRAAWRGKSQQQTQSMQPL